jgi:hypothetical protein
MSWAVQSVATLVEEKRAEVNQRLERRPSPFKKGDPQFEPRLLCKESAANLGMTGQGRPQRAPTFSTLHEARRGATWLERMYRVRLGNLAQLP